MNITSASEQWEICNQKTKFIDTFVKSSTVCTPADITVFKIFSRLNNLIQ